MDAATDRILGALSQEITQARADVERLAEMVRSIVREDGPERRAVLLREAQIIDSLDQHLEALAGFATALSVGTSIEDGLKSVSLADVARRMEDHIHDRQPQSSQARPTAGDFVMFD
jgi:hypothetical protein